MSIVSLRLPEDVEARLSREAERTQRPKSEIARDAIVDYLQRADRERFLAEIARAARARGRDEALDMAEEALPTDNEALQTAEDVWEPRRTYRAPRTRPARRKKAKR
jgi:predicted transcriptional regulator